MPVDVEKLAKTKFNQRINKRHEEFKSMDITNNPDFPNSKFGLIHNIKQCFVIQVREKLSSVINVQLFCATILCPATRDQRYQRGTEYNEGCERIRWLLQYVTDKMGKKRFKQRKQLLQPKLLQ